MPHLGRGGGGVRAGGKAFKTASWSLIGRPAPRSPRSQQRPLIRVGLGTPRTPALRKGKVRPDTAPSGRDPAAPTSPGARRLPAARPGAAAVSAAWGWGGEGRLGDPEVPVEGWVRERRLGAEPASGLRRRRCLVTLSPPHPFLLHCPHPQDVLPQPQVLLQGSVPQAWSAPSAESLGAGGGSSKAQQPFRTPGGKQPPHLPPPIPWKTWDGGSWDGGSKCPPSPLKASDSGGLQPPGRGQEPETKKEEPLLPASQGASRWGCPRTSCGDLVWGPLLPDPYPLTTVV